MRLMLNDPAADRFTLVHGSVVSLSFKPPIRIGHAWIELDDGRIYDPSTDSCEPPDNWYAHAIIDHRYGRLEAYRIFNVTDYHCGPWTDADRAAASAGHWRS